MLINGRRNEKSPKRKCASGLMCLERETGLEPATSTLARRRKSMKLKDNQEVLDGMVLEVTISTMDGFINFQSTCEQSSSPFGFQKAVVVPTHP
ncbi:MAG: hypothetical protein JWM53_351 [bacterium]|nr:hypothetical protein [bacterium]